MFGVTIFIISKEVVMMNNSLRIDENWIKEDEYVVTYICDEDLFSKGEIPIPKQLHHFFGATSGENRIIFFFEGREFPSYLEMGYGDDHYVTLTFSKTLASKFIGIFPDFSSFYQDIDPVKKNESPVLKIEKIESNTYAVRLILSGEDALSKKQAFFDYLGQGKSVTAFKDSYEMLFIRNFFAEIDNRGRADVFMVTAKIKQFYELRENAGKLQDKKAAVTINNLTDAGLDEILSFIMEGPYKTLSEKEYILMETVDEHFYFTMERSLLDEISTDDKRLIVDLMDQKIEYYFERFDGPGLCENLTSLVYDYNTYFHRDFRYSFKDILTDSIPGNIETFSFIDLSRYTVKGFAGVEEWAPIPWVTIMDRNIVRDPLNGVYIQYILNKDAQKLYLTLSCGFLELEQQIIDENNDPDLNTEAFVAQKLQPLVEDIQHKINPQGFELGNKDVDLTDQRFKAGVVFYREYDNQVPNNESLQLDLQIMLGVYEEYYEMCFLNKFQEPEVEEVIEETLEEAIIQDDVSETTDITAEIIIPENETDVLETSETITPDRQKVENVKNDFPEEGHLDDDTAAKAINSNQKTQTDQTQKNQKYKEPKNGNKGIESLKQKTEKIPLNQNPFPNENQQNANHSSGESISQVAILQTQKVLQESTEGLQNPSSPVDQILEKVENLVELPQDIPSTVAQIKQYINENGFTCDENVIENIYLSIKAKPFIILTGIAGIGKTTLARLFAESVGATTENNRYKKISVRPDWHDSKSLLGYLDLNGYFIPGALNDFILAAMDDERKPYFLCLDEMSLARVEYYFSEILSVMESRRHRSGKVYTDRLIGTEMFGRDAQARELYSQLTLPENLFIIGTISSENAYTGISSKLLDRASLIEISQVSLFLQESQKTQQEPIRLGAKFLQSDMITLTNFTRQQDMIREVVTLLEAMNGILIKANAQIGLRVRDEICFYVVYNAEYRLMTQENALDHAILQKILPRIQGKGSAVESVLTDLFKICAGTRSDGAIRNYPGNRGGLFPKSAQKLSAMVKRFDREGETSYWA